MIDVTIIDDHPIVRDGIRSVLETQADLRVRAALADDSQLRADPGQVIILDWELGGAQGPATTIAALRRRFPSTRILIFSAYGREERVRAALDSGASGYVLKGSPASELTSAIRSIAAGGTYLGNGVAPPISRAVDALTPRELEVLRLAAGGASNAEIARSLGISERTVKFHMSSILGRLGAARRAQAVAIARERGLL